MDSYMDEEAGSITKCCGNYLDLAPDGSTVCRSCRQPIKTAKEPQCEPKNAETRLS